MLYAYKSQSNAYHLLSSPYRSHSSKVHRSDCSDLSHCFPLKIFKMFWKCFASKSVNLRWMLLANVLPEQFFVVQFINEKLTQIMDGITYFVDVGRFVQNEKRNVVCVCVWALCALIALVLPNNNKQLVKQFFRSNFMVWHNWSRYVWKILCIPINT